MMEGTKHQLCTSQFLVINQSKPKYERCVIMAMNNMIQQANVITYQSMLSLGVRQANEENDRLMSMMIKTTKTLPTIDLAGQIIAKCSWLTPYSSSGIFAEFKNDADGKKFIAMNPDSFILCVEVGMIDKGKI